MEKFRSIHLGNTERKNPNLCPSTGALILEQESRRAFGKVSHSLHPWTKSPFSDKLSILNLLKYITVLNINMYLKKYGIKNRIFWSITRTDVSAAMTLNAKESVQSGSMSLLAHYS